jgi:lysophospholipid acyltransferase
MAALITSVARQARIAFRPLFISPSPYASLKPLYDILSVVVSMTLLNYVAAPFIIAGYSDSIQLWKLLGWYGHIIVVGGLAFFMMGGSKVFRGIQKSCGVLPPQTTSKGAAAANGNGVKPAAVTQ